jgi:hypothetical protein
MNEIMVGEWTVTGHCTICGSPFLSKQLYDFGPDNKVNSSPVTISSCSCFENKKEISHQSPDLKTKAISAACDPHNMGEM